ncbi:saccharopine dehydrogenase family protein [Kytococcus sedentarius]|uniref:saccharopine dehydrogenase family protein n=1 Tax=Kytococcus sedentarius TaxID=1276 RepID=UPI0035BC280E
MTDTHHPPADATDPAAAAAREFDLVLFGATGFVGRLVAAHLAEHAPADLRIALAGRDRDRLESARSDLPPTAAAWPLVVADASDEASMRQLARRTRVVVTTVGPYARHGRLLVAACAEAGTHSCDLTGEVLFVREAIDAHHERARETGARIVTSCGFDSVPSDLGVLLTAAQAEADGQGTLGRATLHVRSLRGGFSGGTIDSMREQLAQMASDPRARRVALDPYALSPDRASEPDRDGEPALGAESPQRSRALARRAADRLPIERDAATGRWSAPFLMAPYNTRIVRRSNALLGWRHGRGLRYREVHDTGRGPRGAVRAAALAAGLGVVAAGMAWAPTRALLGRVLPAPGEGPSAEAMASGRFVMELDAETTTGARYLTTVAAERDPGYTGTAVMLGESALALAMADDSLPSRTGVLTPATALGPALVHRLRERGFTLETRRVG